MKIEANSNNEHNHELAHLLYSLLHFIVVKYIRLNIRELTHLIQR